MGFIEEWLQGSSKPTTVKRDFSSDNTSYVECTVLKNTSFNWSYTFTVAEKIGASPKRSLGTWRITKQNYPYRGSIVSQIEQAYYNAASQLQTSEERAEEEEEEETEITTTVREETVGGITITMTRTENSLDIRGGEDRVFYTVRDSSPGTSSTVFDSQEEAEELFDYKVQFYTPRPQTSTVYQTEYRGVVIRFQDTNMPDGTDYINETTNQSMDSVFLSGEITEEFPIGTDVSFIDSYGLQEFGTLTGDEDSDLTILRAYIDARLDGREDPNAPEEQYGLLPVYSWGWYDGNRENPLNPFSEVSHSDVFTVSGTDGRILALTDDDFIAQGINSGKLKLVVKPGYRVQLKVMTQNEGFLKSYVVNADSYDYEARPESAFDWEESIGQMNLNYVATEKVKIDLFGGDTLEINIDGVQGVPRYDIFKITQNGKLISRGGAPPINDETFLAVIEVERYEPQENGGENGGGGEGQTTPGNAIPILIGGALILTILYMVLARGGEE